MMRSTKPLPLKATADQHHLLNVALDKVRSTSRTVIVDKASLAAVLTDYARLINALPNGATTPEGAHL